MIDTLDPSQGLPQPVPVTTQPVEPLATDNVSIHDNRLEEEKRSGQEDQLQERRKQKKGDVVELSSRTGAQHSEAEKSEDDTGHQGPETDEHQIDIIIE